MAAATSEIKVFYCYTHEDQEYRAQLEAHMANLKRLYNLQTWFDRDILPGDQGEKVSESHLDSADLIFLLISPAFMSSDYSYHTEMMRALKRHERGEARVIPVLVRSVHWDNAPFSTIHALPSNSIPIARWPDPDDAFYDVVRGVERTIKSLLAAREAQTWLEKGDMLKDLKQYQEAVEAYDQAIRHNPDAADAYYGKGYALNNLKNYEQAMRAFEHAILLKPDFANAYNNKGIALHALKRYNDAIVAFNHAIRLDPNFARAYYNKGVVLNEAKYHDEAIVAFDHAIRLDPHISRVYNNKGIALNELKRYDDALAALEHAIRLAPSFARAYYNKGNALYALKRYDEAIPVFEHAILLDPNFARAHYHKAVALEKVGRYDEAQQAHARARELGFRA